jgi:hypothetical protein
MNEKKWQWFLPRKDCYARPRSTPRSPSAAEPVNLTSFGWKKFREKVVFGVNRSYRPLLYSEKGREMADQDKAGLAFERAWNVYLLINSDVDENDERRAIVERYIRQRCEAGESDTETLTVEGLTYLKKLDELGQYSLR